MQEVSGAYLNDLNGVAQLSSIDIALNQGMYSFLRKSFAPQIQTIARRADVRLSVVRVRRWQMDFEARATECQTGAALALDYGFGNMMIDCSCVCHLRFQNEVIGG